MMLIILFSFLCSIISIEFHLDRQLPLCCMKTITALTPLSDGGITVEAINPSVTILNGINFTNKVAELQADSFVQKILVTPDGGVYFGDYSKIIRKTTQRRTNATFQENQLQSNMILTDKYALVVQKAIKPILKKVDLQKLAIQTYTFQKGQQYFDYRGYLNDLKNGQIAFGERFSIFVLNNETFEVEQQFLTQIGVLKSISSFSSLQESVILIEGSEERYETYRYSKQLKQFEYFKGFYNQGTPLVLTSPTTAVSIYNRLILYWEHFDEQVLVSDWNIPQQIILYSSIALSNSQELIAITRNTSRQIMFISLTANYEIEVKFLVQKSKGKVLKATFTDDDAYLIFSQQIQNSSVTELYKLNMDTQQMTKMMDGDAVVNGLTFLTMKNRLIVCTNRSTQGNARYYIQLRDISTFALISELQISNFYTYSFKLLGNQHWNTNFILLVRTTMYQSEDSEAFRFRVVGDQIQKIQSKIENLMFQSSFACDRYMVSANKDGLIQVYFSQNMTLARNISNDFKYNRFFSQKNLLIAEYEYSPNTSFVYNFSEEIGNIERGFFFRQYFTGRDTSQIRVLFPERAIYLFYYTDVGFIGYPSKLIYDLVKIPVRKFSALPMDTITLSVMIQPVMNNSCIWVFIYSDMKLVRYNDCDPSHSQQVTYQKIYRPQLFVSTDHKYLLFVYNAYNISQYEYTIEVRPTNSITIIVKSFVFRMYRQSLQSIDITSDEKIIIHLDNYLLVFDMEQQQNIANLDIESIDLFDASQDIIAMTGTSKSDSNKSLLVVKRINDPSPLLSISSASLPKIVKMSQSAKRIAVYASDSKLSVWDIKSQMLIIESTYEGVIDLRFITDSKILLQFPENISIISFKAVQNSQLSINFTKITPNNDGTLFAVLVNPTNVKVLNSSLVQVANFIAPNSNMVDVGFSSLDELYGITSNGTLFILSPTPCPDTFINVDSICSCPQNTTDIAGICTCKQNFIQQKNACLCMNGFTFDGSNCFCNSNASVIQSICECRDNFVPIDNKCICGNEFSYINGQCIECSFMCSSCDGSGAFDCTQYSAVFYVGIAGVCVIGVALIVIIVCIVKRRREKGSFLQSNLTDHKDNESNNQNSLGEQLFDGKQHK